MTCCPHCFTDLSATHRELKPQRVHLRAALLPALYELARADRALTLNDLAAFCDRAKLSAHFAQLRFWHFIERPDAAHYRATEHGKNFVNGFCAIPEWVWTLNNRVVEPLKDAEEAPLLHIWELAPKDFQKPTASQTVYQPQLLPV